METNENRGYMISHVQARPNDQRVDMPSWPRPNETALCEPKEATVELYRYTRSAAAKMGVVSVRVAHV
jgi:hypothetical protein